MNPERLIGDQTRRNVLLSVVGLTALSTVGSTEAQAQTNNPNDRGFQAAPLLFGPAENRPQPGSEFFDNKTRYTYIYEDYAGSRSVLSEDDDAWRVLNYTQQQVVTSADDLPEPTNGTHTLEDNTAYMFNGFVTSQYGLELGASTPLIGRHGSVDGFIHTGGGTAISGTNAGFFARDLYVHAPGGTLFDLTADQSAEMLVESCSFSDAAGIAPIASLGTIDGYRVPSFKGCNFEDFASGLTFTGTPEKIFVEGCPLRGVTASGVTILTFDSALNVDIVDMSNNYVKGVQADTIVLDVDPAATVNDIFQYRGTTHDSTVTQSNILTGAASVDAVGYRVSDSYPLSNSKSYIDYTLDAEATATISTQAASKTDGTAYVRIPGTTTERGAARFSHADNEATYNGKRDRIAELTAAVSLGTGTSDIVAVAWFVNGSIVPGTATRVQMNQQGGGVAKSVTATGLDGQMEIGDVFDVRVANLGSTSDITVGELNAKIST